MSAERFYTITYDIPDDGRPVKVANTLKGFGERVQLSVFECWLSPAQLQQLKQLLQKRLEPTEDGVRIYPVGGAVEVLGVGRISENPDYLILKTCLPYGQSN
ncbi:MULTISPECIES: CRISPR-associated endonuclease Cas2 [unclassified Meiothermus]|uniref:CRISPR-associated endonuclease Cas2 n=1 Tax=unclassified Meiothermus TaxID=370471 RepID=UPI000D7CE471|nr:MULTISPECIES: CRISPR-associated endonuclease Cas2 [unclassified Meiothermus]PZA07277.1 CRISPR-associated endonuclease Cas2 [Meiothermus sp. Pnk-1]RYM38011.1 CRISPR-associated endonuclease Cas2 [Meiothermus sp. PNK-Is4]